MPNVLIRVLGALCAELTPAAVAVAVGDERVEDAVASLTALGVRVDRVAAGDRLAADVSLLVAPIEQSGEWPSGSPLALYVGDGAIALDGGAAADAMALLADYGDARSAALADRLRRQGEEIATLRAQLAGTGRMLTHPVSDLEIDPAAEQREASAERRFAEAYDPPALLAALGWEDASESMLAGPLPIDRRPDGPPAGVVRVEAGESARELLRTCWSVLERSTRPLTLEIALAEEAPAEVRRAASQVATLGAGIEVVSAGDEPSGSEGAESLTAGELLPPGWPSRPEPPASVAFVLPGLPPGGSGGSHSIVQEVLGLRELGIETTLVTPQSARDRVGGTYPEVLPALVTHAAESELATLVASSEVVVATEHSSVPAVVEATRASGGLPVYYVQDYEAFFAADASERGDAAVLSYRATPGLRLFAKTHWLANLVAAFHATPVDLITPSVDRSLFHRKNRAPAGSGDRLRVSAMVRPRTPRRRPAATVRFLDGLRKVLGPEVEIVSFGCDATDLTTLSAGKPPDWEHHGILGRAAVAELLRGSDLFVDLSVYQAFGRTGCEAMAAGAVAVLPSVGGVAQYATDGANALLVDGADLDRVLASVVALLSDRRQLAAFADAGAEAVAGLTIESAARSWADGLGAALAAR
jgi:glycosyltransferase involved in cell wall biosynthesis